MNDAVTQKTRYEVFRWYLRYLPIYLYGVFRATLSRGKFGHRPFMRGKICLDIRGQAVFGSNSFLNGRPAGIMVTVEKGATLTVGHKFFMNWGTSIEAYCDIRIGDNVMLAPNASITDHNQHDTEPGARSSKGPVTIGSNVWLGRNVVVTPGVSIGDGSVIGANSVVSRDIPPNCLAVGAPAQVIRKLEIPDGWARG